MTCEVPEGGGGGRGSGPPLKNHKIYGFLATRSGSPENSQIPCQHSILGHHIGTPAKRHVMAFRWRADDGALILDPPSPHHLKTLSKLDPH